jgi:tetratricopeptide (TPR) repeat protein
MVILSLAHARLGNHSLAEADIVEAERICRAEQTSCTPQVRGELLSAKGSLALESDSFREAEDLFKRSLLAAQANSDKFLETRTLLNLSVIDLQQEHFEDALERANAASKIARSIGAKQALEKALGNVGWAYYQTGDFERARAAFKDAAESADRLGAPIDEVAWLTNAGLSEYRLANFDAAQTYYKRSLELAKSLQNDEEAGNADVALASLMLHTGCGSLHSGSKAIRLETKQRGRRDPTIVAGSTAACAEG